MEPADTTHTHTESINPVRCVRFYLFGRKSSAKVYNTSAQSTLLVYTVAHEPSEYAVAVYVYIVCTVQLLQEPFGDVCVCAARGVNSQQPRGSYLALALCSLSLSLLLSYTIWSIIFAWLGCSKVHFVNIS